MLDLYLFLVFWINVWGGLQATTTQWQMFWAALITLQLWNIFRRLELSK